MCFNRSRVLLMDRISVLPEAEFWDVWTDFDCNDGHPLVDSCHLQKLDFYDRKTNKRCVLPEVEFWDVWTDFDCNDGHPLVDSCHLQKLDFYDRKTNKRCVLTEAEFWDVWTDIDCNDGHLLMDRISVLPDAEFWDVWTDFDSNDGHPLVDRCHHFKITKMVPIIHVTGGTCLERSRVLGHVDMWTDIDGYDHFLPGGLPPPRKQIMNKGCVLPEADFWDVWTDFDCNDGHPLVDRVVWDV
ncbi:hypothetical protein ROHU_026578 [Labeo rohita]|uniref:Uncharacterized protein n=1 Tax=Labeo rohita TaxID=84645 RepID=A0A498MAA0_LABRO|nr:hypothetical protein ROHU_026578 [Labeo rohita]